MKSNENLSGFIPMRILSGYGKDKEPYEADSTKSRPYKEKSKDKKRKKDWSKERERKKGFYD